MNMAAAESSVRFSDHTLDKATKAKVTLENYYSNLIAQNGERKQRLAKLEASLKDETLTETQKQVSTDGSRYCVKTEELIILITIRVIITGINRTRKLA